MKRSLILFTVVLTALLAGCAAPSVVSNVTVFHTLTGTETNKTYMVEATPEQANNLEFSSYVTLLNQELQHVGYVMVNKDPSLKVSLNYGTTQAVASSLQPAPIYGPYGFRHGPYYGSGWQTSVDTVFMHHMEVSISRIADGKNIYTVRSRLMSPNPELSISMDYLMDSAFQNFPGKNGSTETITLPVHQ
ncbi:DUF4136 domain-containing protein [Solimicrobium silvestre]|uniref:DUF4136 domain-containing protein n=1 Tax=Solimicrobium silvestre TaxID=2099400 RepID=A0A2S9H5I9_9BURK|nr:DUF4136 domain-containing protein [Solimicrobium silvestre]PRC95237.1 hypothetical protein S2091_0432 [Solimicrobium silvestre]